MTKRIFLRGSFYGVLNGNMFSIVKKSCALGYYSFGHEIAHNLGALHNPEVSNNNVFPEGHGHLIALVRALIFTIRKFLIYKS